VPPAGKGDYSETRAEVDIAQVSLQPLWLLPPAASKRHRWPSEIVCRKRSRIRGCQGDYSGTRVEVDKNG
jgi:hypothetical protein